MVELAYVSGLSDAARRTELLRAKNAAALQAEIDALQAEIDALQVLTTPGAWTAPTFLNSWTNYGSGWQAAQYRKVGDTVQVRGLVKKATGGPGTNIFTLPAGFRPSSNIIGSGQGYTSVNGYIQVRINVYTSGNVYMETVYEGGALGGNVDYLSLDGLSFSVTA